MSPSALPQSASASLPDWNCKWGPSGGRGPYSLYPHHVWALMLPQKETKYSYNAFQARDRRDKSECDSAVCSSLHGTQECHLVLFRFFNTKNVQKYQNFHLATQMEHDQSSYFCRGPDNLCWGSAPVGPTLVTGSGSPTCQLSLPRPCLNLDSSSLAIACVSKKPRLHLCFLYTSQMESPLGLIF